MGKTYTATTKVQCWKEHTCVCCGAVYSYQFVRTVSGRGATEDKAQAALKTSIQRTLERDVDMQPCPTCGLYQPDMLAQQRGKRHKWVFWLALLSLILIAILRASHVVQANRANWVALIVVAAAGALHIWVQWSTPNADPAANALLATQQVSEGKVRYQPGTMVRATLESLAHPGTSAGEWLCVGLMLGAVVLAPAAEVMRMSHGWPLNPGCYPPVVSVGDSTRIYMNREITSIKGYWRGRPEAYVRRADGTGQPVAVGASTKDNNWGSTIYAKSSEKQSSSTPWVEVVMPMDQDLAGRTVNCDIRLDVEYPAASGSSSFETVSDEMERSVAISLAGKAGAGSVYNEWAWTGLLVGPAMLLLAGQGLWAMSRALRRKALPTRVLPPAPPAPQMAGQVGARSGV